jgi:hypothetical protein
MNRRPFWSMTNSSLLQSKESFLDYPKMETANSSETLVINYQSTRRNIPKDCIHFFVILPHSDWSIMEDALLLTSKEESGVDMLRAYCGKGRCRIFVLSCGRSLKCRLPVLINKVLSALYKVRMPYLELRLYVCSSFCLCLCVCLFVCLSPSIIS